MTMLKELRAKRTALADEMQQLADAGELDEAQQTRFDEVCDEFQPLDAQIRRLEKAAEAQAALAEPRPAAGQAQATATVPAAQPEIPATMSLASALERHGPVGDGAPKHFECFEEFLASVLDARTGLRSDARLSFSPERSAEQRMDTGSKGGFMVPSEFRNQLLEVSPAETPLLSAATHLAAGASPDAKVELPALNQDTNQYGGVTVARTSEGGGFTETDSDLEVVGWTPDEIGAHIALTEKLIRNWSGATGLAQRLMRTALNATLEQEAFSGTGGAQMRGILTSGALYKVNRNTANQFLFVDVANMVQRSLQRGGGKFWLYNQLLLSQLMQMKDGNNNLIWQNNVREGAPQTLFGLPAMPYEFASAVGALGDVVLVQPNPYYVIKDGSGPFVDMGRINADFTNGKVRIRIFMSNDGGPWLKAPFKLQNGTEVSPFVALDVPAS